MTLPKDIEEAIEALRPYATPSAPFLLGMRGADELRAVIARHLAYTPTQRQRYKEALLASGHPMLSACALADDAVAEDAEHAKKGKHENN